MDYGSTVRPKVGSRIPGPARGSWNGIASNDPDKMDDKPGKSSCCRGDPRYVLHIWTGDPNNQMMVHA